MNKLKLFLILLLIISIPNVSSLCGENQININTATAVALDALKGIGPVKADAIIGSRPFSSVDELINVKGIGEITLQNIKDQGLACVEDEETQETVEEVIEEQTEEEVSKEEIKKEIEEVVPLTGNVNIENEEINIENIEVIKLVPKDIKSDENIESSNKNNYAMYGFVIFCVLLGFLFLFKRRKFENEFD